MAEFSSLMWPKRTPECITARRKPRPDRWRLVRHSTSDHLHQNASENIRAVATAVTMGLTVTDGDAPMLTTTATTIVCCPLSESITQTRLAHGFQVNTLTTPESVKPNQHPYREEGFWNLTNTHTHIPKSFSIHCRVNFTHKYEHFLSSVSHRVCKNRRWISDNKLDSWNSLPRLFIVFKATH